MTQKSQSTRPPGRKERRRKRRRNDNRRQVELEEKRNKENVSLLRYTHREWVGLGIGGGLLSDRIDPM